MFLSLRNLYLDWRTVVIILTPIIFSPLAVSSYTEARCGYVILTIATYWMTEAMPIAVSSLIPVFAFPVLGVMSTNDVCLVYLKETNMMFLGGLIVAIAVEHSNLHQRIALFVLLHVGQSPRRLMAGFMIITMFLSMWISNTATTALMAPIVTAVLAELSKDCKVEDAVDMETAKAPHQGEVVSGPDQRKTDDPKEEGRGEVVTQEETYAAAAPSPEHHRRLRSMCFLGTAYAANVGGTGSLTGTGPNLVVKGILESTFSEPTGLNFATWMAFNVPGMLICVTLAWLWLQFLYIGIGKSKKIPDITPERREAVKNLIKRQYAALGKITFHEAVVFSLFSLLILCWLFRAPEFIPGWGEMFKSLYGPDIKVGNSSPVMLVVVLLFVLPSKLNFWPFVNRNDKGRREASPGCLNWEVVNEKMPWWLVLLLGGGFAMAAASKASGLSIWLGQLLANLDVLPKEAIVIVVSLMTAMVTEVASNAATSAVVLPVVMELAIAIKVNPLYLMIPAAVCCSYAFMLPVATAPNAIAYGAANLRSVEMLRAGIVMNVLCTGVINMMINTLGVAMFDLKALPPWINSTIISAADQ